MTQKGIVEEIAISNLREHLCGKLNGIQKRELEWITRASGYEREAREELGLAAPNPRRERVTTTGNSDASFQGTNVEIKKTRKGAHFWMNLIRYLKDPDDHIIIDDHIFIVYEKVKGSSKGVLCDLYVVPGEAVRTLLEMEAAACSLRGLLKVHRSANLNVQFRLKPDKLDKYRVRRK